jgi:hypothetical protein
MPNPYKKRECRLPLVPRSSFAKRDKVEDAKETKRQFKQFVVECGPPDPCDYDNKRDETDGFSIPSSINLLLDESVSVQTQPVAATTKPIAEAAAKQERDSGDESFKAASLMMEDLYICNDCGNNPCDWLKHGPAVREYHQLQLDLYGPEKFMPPHNVQRHRLYRQMAQHLGFVRRAKHSLCVLEGVHQIVPSPTDDYMGHRDVWTYKNIN